MKVLAASILVIIMVSFSVIISPMSAYNEPNTGVKEGDWMEYGVNIIGNPPAIHRSVTWMRIEVLQVEGAAFPVNLTVRYANGTLYSSIWKLNFTEGNLEGWIIIPSNLSPGDTFYDAFSKADKNIIIQSQEQKTVLGASRTVTYANDSYRHKEWDKTTGVFIGSSEILKNWTADVNIIATNIWSPQILEQNQTFFLALVAESIVLAVLILSSIIAVARRKRIRRLTLRCPSQGKTLFQRVKFE